MCNKVVGITAVVDLYRALLIGLTVKLLRVLQTRIGYYRLVSDNTDPLGYKLSGISIVLLVLRGIEYIYIV
jgi:hypothetical protein